MATTIGNLSLSQLCHVEDLPSTLRPHTIRTNLRPQLDLLKTSLELFEGVGAAVEASRAEEEGAIYDFVNSEMLMILHTAADAVALASRPGHNYEAETRMLWDRLIFVFFRGARNHEVKVAPYLERTIAFSENPLKKLVPSSAPSDSSVRGTATVRLSAVLLTDC
ncbi:hypothetical protein FA95DRAFT_73194 [Auriscalpium vulgare]|uniref:Uncharacterized protein n=1 Tax=Auriscalpium vulgare TaxID=40419 RepID=A0ACB8RPV9_9AGAM|nr:hypothetical protein FA95DRAFT_73194 [Auriscalpium vulgare]